MIRKTIACIILTAGLNSTFGQAPTLVNVIPPSPNVQAMQKYGDIPVSPYTGVPDISVPIYTAKFRDISIPISLSYHSSGIKVSEEASEVGLGWVLNAAGTVSRNIIGTDDFTSNYFTNSIMTFDSGQGPTHNVQMGCNLQMFNSTIQDSPTIYNYDVTSYLQSLYEFQPDQYYFNFPGHSGKFVMTRSYHAVLQKQESIQVTCQSSTGASWQIKSEDGYTYDFALQELYQDPSTGQTHICAWYLTKITSPTGNTAVFNYTSNPTIIQGIGNYTELKDDKELYFSGGSPSIPPPMAYQYGLRVGNIYQTKFLTSIDLDNCHIQFYYSGNRADVDGDQRLDSISVFGKDKTGNTLSAPFRTTAFAYSYFNYGDIDDGFFQGSPVPNSGYDERLKLTQIQNTGYYGGSTLQDNPYVFTYYEGSSTTNLPSKGSFAKDHWGYFNGKEGHLSLIPSVIPVNTDDQVAFYLGLQGPERDPDTSYISAFSLKSIQYPTGGSTTFQYQSNDFDEYNSDIYDNSYYRNTPNIVQATKTFGYDAVSHTLNGDDTLHLENLYTGIGFLGQPVSSQINMNAAFRFSNTSDCSVMPQTNTMYFGIYDSTGNNLVEHYDLAYYSSCSGSNTTGCYTCGSGVFTIKDVLSLPPGKYIFKAVNTGPAPDTLENIIVTFSYVNEIPLLPTTITSAGLYYSFGGGQRISRIINHDPLTNTGDRIKKYVYHYFSDKVGSGSLQEYSFGRRMSKPEYAYFLPTPATYSSMGPDGCVGLSPYYIIRLMRSSDSFNPLNGSAAGQVVGYDQVTELFGENGEFGKKVYTYNNLPDYIPNYPEPYSGQNLPIQPPYGSSIPNALNGTLTGETDYAFQNGGFVKVKDITNQYTTVLAQKNYVYGIENRKAQANNLGDACMNIYPNICDGYSFTLSYVTMPSEWQHIISSEEKDYNQADINSYVDTYTNYFYDNPSHLQLTRTVTTNSKGEVVTTATQYPLDFTNVSATDAFTLGIANLQRNHVVNKPAEIHIDKKNADGSNPRTTGSYLMYYNASSPTESAVYRTEDAAAITNFTPATTTSSGLSSSPYYKPFLYFDTYDAYGNVLQQHKANDVYHSYIWDYANSLPVAEVVNASCQDIAYTSFEADGKGGWTFAGAPSTAGGAITGGQSYSLSSGSISKSGLTYTTKYIVSGWTKGTVTLTGGTLSNVITGKTINGWTYLEVTVTGTTSVTISGGAGVYIDELRLYPSNAQMTTYTFTPLIGMTGQCDADNRISYYFYDALGRLEWIKDQDGNIIKTFQYHYSGVPGTLY